MNGEISFGPMGSAIPDDPFDAEGWQTIGTVDGEGYARGYPDVTDPALLEMVDEDNLTDLRRGALVLDTVDRFDTAPIVLNRQFHSMVKIVVTEVSKSWESLLVAVLGAKAGIEAYRDTLRKLERRERHTANARRNRLRRKRRARRRKRG